MPAANSAILIVDDDSHYRSLLRERLQNAGYLIAEAADGVEAVEILRVESYDVILLDLNMPNMDGYEVLEWLNQNKNTKDTNVIVMTADSKRDTVVTTLTLGAKDFITKTAGKLEMLTRIRYLSGIKVLEQKTHEKISDEELANSKILIVDDEPLSIELTARRIEKQGFTVLRADSGEQAISMAKEQDIQLILLDINMPDMDGYTTLKHLREYKAKEELAIVMVTAIEEPDTVIDCIKAGADDYIMKPFHPTELIARITTVLRFSLLLNKEYLQHQKHQALAELGTRIRNTDS
jgi:DNA-binding response OmpR family regulator